MKAVTRNILTAAVLMAALIYIASFLGVSAGKRNGAVCSGIRIAILDSARNSFVTPSEIRGYLKSEFGEIKGKPLNSLDLVRIEKAVNGRSAVRKSEAFTTPDGILHVEVTQREPVVRFENQKGGFYSDSDGYIFPLQSSYTSYVPILDGDIPVRIKPGYKGEIQDAGERKWLMTVLEMIDYMKRHDGWSDRIVQMSVRKNGDIVMIPREGKERFIFGRPDNYEEKFRMMGKYYTSIVPAKGEGYYSTVNVKYAGQVICRR